MPKGSKNLAAGGNPLEIVQDPRVLSAGAGVLAAQLGRKAIIETNRETFGWAVKTSNGVKFVASKKDASGKIVPDVRTENGALVANKETPNAVLNRVLLNCGMVIAGTLLIGQSDDPNIEYFGLGAAAGGAANVFATLFNLEI